nr:putative F-box protein At1g19160 [Ipomoea batatas]
MPLDFPHPNKVFSFFYKEAGSDEIGSTYLDIPNSITRYVNCCHGLLCVIVGKGDFIIDGIEVVDMVFDVVIWNPSTREIKTLPSITVPNKPSNIPPINFCLYEGFGFGLSNNMTWKVVMLWYYGDVDVLSKDSYEIVLVCSRVGDSWTWRQIKAVSQLPVSSFENFYLKGKCYWRVEVPQWLSSGPCRKEFLIWFDLDEEIFGTIELPSKWVATLSILVTVMNDTIALVSAPDIENENCIEIWLMNETNNNIDWNKQASIECGESMDLHDYWNPTGGDWESEYWNPIGIWNLGDVLLVFPTLSRFIPDLEHEFDYLPGQDTYIPYLISIDLATQKRNIIYLTQQRKSVSIVSNSTGYAQIYRERNINIVEEWKNNVKIIPDTKVCVRGYSESLKFL